MVLDAVVGLGGGNLEQVVVHASAAVVYGDVVVVENNQNVGLHRTGVVESLEGHASCHGSVAYDGDYLLVAAGKFRCRGQAEGGADGCG